MPCPLFWFKCFTTLKPRQNKKNFNRPTHLHFRFYFGFNKPTEYNPPNFKFSCSIFTIMSILITETSGPLTPPALSSSISLPLSPRPSPFYLELITHYFNHCFANSLKYLALLPRKSLTLDQMKKLFYFYTSATSKSNKLTEVANDLKT